MTLHDDADPIEHDPTGMRALLGSLPDPGPMPEDLVTRIGAAIAAQADADGRPHPSWAAPECPDPVDDLLPFGADPDGRGADDGVVVPLRRRRLVRGLGVAAAAVVVLGVGGAVVQGLGSSGATASLGMAQKDASAAGGSAARGPANLAGAGEGSVVADDAALDVLVVASGATYTVADLGGQASALPQPEAGATALPRTDEGAADPDETVSTPAGARACATALGVPGSEPVTVDLATVDGSIAAVLVATRPDGSRTAWAVDRGCRAGSTGLVGGPVDVG